MELDKYSFYNKDNKYLKLKLHLNQFGGEPDEEEVDDQQNLEQSDEKKSDEQQSDEQKSDEQQSDEDIELNNSKINFYEYYSLDDPRFLTKGDDSNDKDPNDMIVKKYSKISIIPSSDYLLHNMIKLHAIIDKIQDYNYLDYGTKTGLQSIILFAISKKIDLGTKLSIDATTTYDEITKTNLIENFKDEFVSEKNVIKVEGSNAVGKNISSNPDDNENDPLKDKKYHLIKSNSNLISHLEIIDTIKRLYLKLDSKGVLVFDLDGNNKNKNNFDIFKINSLININRNYPLKQLFGMDVNDILKVSDSDILIIKKDSDLKNFFENNFDTINKLEIYPKKETKEFETWSDDDLKKEIINLTDELNSIKIDPLNFTHLEDNDKEIEKIFNKYKLEVLRLFNNKQREDYSGVKTNLSNLIEQRKKLKDEVDLKLKIKTDNVDEAKIIRKYIEEDKNLNIELLL